MLQNFAELVSHHNVITLAALYRLAEQVFRNEGPSCPNPVLLVGDDPFERGKLAAFLREYKIESYALNPNESLSDEKKDDSWSEIFSYHPPVVVVGGTKWFSTALATLRADAYVRETPINSQGYCYEITPPCRIEKDERDGEIVLWRSPRCSELTFVSQNHFLECLFSRSRPTKFLQLPKGFTIENVILGIERSSTKSEYFPWPATEAPRGSGQVPESNWPQIGLLSYMGYRVGIEGKLKAERLHILSKVFNDERLPQVGSAAYMAEWDRARSGTRLKKMAESIAAFCRNAKRRQWALMGRAVDNWKDDLTWLKQSYYDGRFDGSFHWPTME